MSRNALSQRFGLIKDPLRMLEDEFAWFRQTNSTFRPDEQGLT
jgi:hypothetical protein